MSNGPRKRNVHRKLKRGQVPAVGQVVYGDVNGDEWVIEGPEGEGIREMLRANCPECSGDHGHGWGGTTGDRPGSRG